MSLKSKIEHFIDQWKTLSYPEPSIIHQRNNHGEEENHKFKRVIDEMQKKLIEAYEKQTQIESLIVKENSNLALKIS